MDVSLVIVTAYLQCRCLEEDSSPYYYQPVQGLNGSAPVIPYVGTVEMNLLGGTWGTHLLS